MVERAIYVCFAIMAAIVTVAAAVVVAYHPPVPFPIKDAIT